MQTGFKTLSSLWISNTHSASLCAPCEIGVAVGVSPEEVVSTVVGCGECVGLNVTLGHSVL